MKNSDLFNKEIMWQTIVTFEKGMTEEEKKETLQKIAKLTSAKSPIVDLQISESKLEGLVVVYRPDTIPEIK